MHKKTLDEITTEIVGADVCRSFENVEIQQEEPEKNSDLQSITELARKYLSPETDQAFDQIDLKHEQIGFSLKFRDLEVEGKGQGFSAILIGLVLLVLVAGAGATNSLLQHVLGR